MTQNRAVLISILCLIAIALVLAFGAEFHGAVAADPVPATMTGATRARTLATGLEGFNADHRFVLVPGGAYPEYAQVEFYVSAVLSVTAENLIGTVQSSPDGRIWVDHTETVTLTGAGAQTGYLAVPYRGQMMALSFAVGSTERYTPTIKTIEKNTAGY